MSDVYSEPFDQGYELGCYIGIHSYTNGICAWCDKRTPPHTGTRATEGEQQ